MSRRINDIHDLSGFTTESWESSPDTERCDPPTGPLEDKLDRGLAAYETEQGKARSQRRKDSPLAQGCLYYFPAALLEVARLSKLGNDKHNPGQPIHWSRGKSEDHADALLRHQVDVGEYDEDWPGEDIDHAVNVAWRALAQLQQICEARGAKKARGAK
jgi:hypothetical protein